MATLLFVNTFSHDTIEDFNIDYVKFSAGALATVREIRIIPGGASVPVAESPQRQGLTAPNSFSVEVFARSFKQTDASVFERVALFDYNFDSDIRFQVPAYTTDGILFKGKYTALTVAIYGDPMSGDALSKATLSASKTALDGVEPAIGSSSSQLPSSAPFAPIPTDNSGGLLTAPNVFSGQGPAHILTVGAPIPTWVSPPPPVMHMPPPATYNPMVPPPISVMPPYSPAPGSTGPAGVFGPGPTHTTGGVVVPAMFDPTRPPPAFLTPQHSPQIVPQASPSDQRHSQGPSRSRRQPEHSVKSKRRHIESAKEQAAKEETPMEVVKPILSSSSFQKTHEEDSAAPGMMDELQLEEGEYANSEGETSEKFDLENISDEEFEFDDTMAADMNESEFQEDLLSAVRFDPYRCVVEPLKHFQNPDLSSFEVAMHAKNIEGFREDGEKLIALMESSDMERSDERWVFTLEEICNVIPTGLVYVLSMQSRTETIDKLILWTLDGLDMDKACQQQTFCTLRHLKAGIRLATLFFETEESIAVKLCNGGIQHRLMDLLECDTTSTPIMLQVMNALDSSIFFGVGLDSCLLSSADSNEHYSRTPFQRLTRFVMKKRPSRVMVAIRRFMQKVVLHQSLKTIFISAKKMADRARNSDSAPTNGDDQDSIQSLDTAAILDEEEISSLCESMARVTKFYCNAPDVLGQPPRCLPTSTVFTLSPTPTDPYPAMYCMFNRHHLLPCLYLLLSNWTTGNEPRILTTIHQLLSSLLSSHSGLLYLASKRDVVQEMLKLLLQKEEEGVEESGTSLMQDFGLDLAYHLRCLHYVDELMNFHSQSLEKLEIDNLDVLKILQSFYALTLDNHSNDRRGVRSTIRILAQKDYLASILPFIELTGDIEWDSKIKKSACAGYASDLLLMVIRHAESVDYLHTFLERILTISSHEVTSKVAEIKQWVEPLRKLPGFTVDSLEYLSERIKYFVQTEGIVPRIPKGLITTLRVTRHISLEPQRHEGLDRPNELRYKYALVQLHYHGVLSVLLELIDKLADSQLLNWQQGIGLNNKHGHNFYACVLPTVSLIRSILSHLIHCRGNDYKDLTPISPLLKLYTVCCTLSPSFGTLRESQIVRQDIITALLAFTQPEINDISKVPNQEDAEESLWTKMLTEVLNFAEGAPCRYVAGLHILSELLPLPLPVPTKEALSSEESRLIQCHRRLWSCFLSPVSLKIQSVIRNFACSTQQIMQQGLRRVCLQLSDLSANMANIVVRAIVEVALENCEITEPRKASAENEEASSRRRALVLPMSSGSARALNLLSYMCSQPSFKACLLHLIQSKREKPSVDDCGRLFNYLLVVINHTSDEKSHRMSQELIMSTIQSLCDDEVSMITASTQVRSASQRLSCCLPSAHQLQEICCALVRHVGDRSQTYATILPALRILVMLCEHDYGFECIKAALQAEHRVLLSFFQRLLDEFSGHSSDCISTLSTLLLLLRSLQTAEEGAQTRTKRISAPLAKKILGWETGSSNENHCLVKLEKLLAGVTEEDSSLYSLHDDVTNLMEMLSSGVITDTDSGEDEALILLPPSMDIQQQFSERQVWVICDDPSEDRLQSHYWFPPDVLEDDEEQETERIPVDLETMVTQCLPGFDLAKELTEKISAKRAEEAEAIKRKSTPGIINTSRGERKRFIAPLRGRGVMLRGGLSTRLNDPFRSRVPNTSRPPSMHVDDFILAQHIRSSAGGPAGEDGGDTNRSTNAGKAVSRQGRAETDQGGTGRSGWYRGTNTDIGGRTVTKMGTAAAGGPMRVHRPKENVFDRPRERQAGPSGHAGNKSTRTVTSHKSPSRHPTASK